MSSLYDKLRVDVWMQNNCCQLELSLPWDEEINTNIKAEKRIISGEEFLTYRMSFYFSKDLEKLYGEKTASPVEVIEVCACGRSGLIAYLEINHESGTQSLNINDKEAACEFYKQLNTLNLRDYNKPIYGLRNKPLPKSLIKKFYQVLDTLSTQLFVA